MPQRRRERVEVRREGATEVVPKRARSRPMAAGDVGFWAGY